MAQFQNLLEVFKLLDKSNCRKCNEPTCMAFAAKVFKGERLLSECPRVPDEIARQYGTLNTQLASNAEEMENELRQMKAAVAELDFAETAERINATFDGQKLTLKVLGKNFSVDTRGNLYSDIHVNPWVTMPVLTYILNCKGTPVTGNWLTLRELPGGMDRERFFNHRCTAPMKRIADVYTDLFQDMVDIFNGRAIPHHYQSDIAVVLHPLPLVPMLICYWKPAEEMASDLTLFFDASARDNIGVGGLFSLGTGIVRMFEKLALRHGIRSGNP